MLFFGNKCCFFIQISIFTWMNVQNPEKSTFVAKKQHDSWQWATMMLCCFQHQIYKGENRLSGNCFKHTGVNLKNIFKMSINYQITIFFHFYTKKCPFWTKLMLRIRTSSVFFFSIFGQIWLKIKLELTIYPSMQNLRLYFHSNSSENGEKKDTRCADSQH